MQRSCDVCGQPFTAQKSTARYCSGKCRAKASDLGGVERKQPRSLDDLDEMRAAGLIEAVERDLAAAGRLNTVLGQQALLLARRIGLPMDTGASVASMSRELREVMARAVDGVPFAADPLDEIAARRAAKLIGD